ncbi:MAG: PAS domain-containing protein [Anaerolineae bacterium]|nr:PAS domain-containing protein [Anaerolineae bacterium]
MTQVNTTQDSTRQNVLGEIISLIAANPASSENINAILKLVQAASAATSASFILFDEPKLVISSGDSDSWINHEQILQSFTAKLSDKLNINPPLIDGLASKHQNWLAAPLRNGKLDLGLLWLSFDTLPPLADTLDALVDSLSILASNLHAHESHEHSHQLTISLLTSITDPLLVLDDDRNLLLMNPAAETVFKAKADQVRGKSLREIVQSEELIALGSDETKKLAEWISPDEKTFVPRIEAVRDAQGSLEGWVLALRDVTQFKKLNRNQSEFMRIVSHDLRSPLTAMQGFASMLELGLVGEMNEKQNHFVSKILAGIAQMTALVENIQDAGRYDPESGFYELTRSHCDLGEMLRKIVDNQLVPAEKALTISVSIADNVPIINADTNMLERAIINLVDNAIKYTPSGGKVEVGAKCENNEVIVTVKDSGLGIDAQDQQHLFERHVRIARQEHKKIKGSGLGLFIVRSVAQRHGGDAWVESTQGKGSTFYLGIPLDGPNLVTAKE